MIFFTQSVQNRVSICQPSDAWNRSAESISHTGKTIKSTQHLFKLCSHLKYLSPTLHPPHCHQSKKRKEKNQDEVVVVASPLFCDRHSVHHLPGLLYHPPLFCWYLFFNYLPALPKLNKHLTEIIIEYIYYICIFAESLFCLSRQCWHWEYIFTFSLFSSVF